MMGEAMVLTAEIGWKRERFLDEVMRREPWPDGREALAASFDAAVARIGDRRDRDAALTVVPEGHGALPAQRRGADAA